MLYFSERLSEVTRLVGLGLFSPLDGSDFSSEMVVAVETEASVMFKISEFAFFERRSDFSDALRFLFELVDKIDLFV